MTDDRRNDARTSRSRPRLAFAMTSDALRSELFPADLMARLRAVAEVDERVLTELDSPATREALANADALITGWGSPVIDARALAGAPRLRLIAHAAGTVKGHIRRDVWERGVQVTTAAQANAAPVADFALACILLAGKNTLESAALLRERQADFRKSMLRGDVGNYGATVGIIGASRIGRLVLERLRPLNYRVLLNSPWITAEEAAELGAELVPLDRLMAESHVVSLHSAVVPATIGMIGREQLAAMRDGATFINTARGALVDHDALREEIGSGRISAILDVTDPEPLPTGDPLYRLGNVLLTPHIAGSLGNELPMMGASAVDEVERFAAGSPLHYPVTIEELDRMA